jgi:hypothetical protein
MRVSGQGAAEVKAVEAVVGGRDNLFVSMAM